MSALRFKGKSWHGGDYAPPKLDEGCTAFGFFAWMFGSLKGPRYFPTARLGIHLAERKPLWFCRHLCFEHVYREPCLEQTSKDIEKLYDWRLPDLLFHCS